MTIQNVKFKRKELEDKIKSYDLLEDVLKGSEAVKAKGIAYLTKPDASNHSTENNARYDAYKQRAVFYNVTQRTATGLLGQIFSREPKVEVPKALESVIADATGEGVGLTQLAKKAAWEVLGYGRSGVYVDYPIVSNKTLTKADLETGKFQPTITVYKPKNILNWRFKKLGSKSILCLVVLQEEYTDEDDGFETKTGVQYRELRLGVDGKYFVQLWRAKEIGSDDFIPYGSPTFPTKGDGLNFDYIPFTFIGSQNNEGDVDNSPLYDMAIINIAHYNNSADHEESIFVVGQPMLVISGLTQEWYKDVLKEKVPFGSRSGLALPENGKAELIQAEANTMAFTAMEHKERQMIALGAKLVEQKQVQRTATESSQANAAENSTLSTISKNVSAALKLALEWCAVFVNQDGAKIEFELNSDFEISQMSPEQVAARIKAWMDGAISWTELRGALHKAGVAFEKDDVAKAEIEAQQATDFKVAQDAINVSNVEAGVTNNGGANVA